MSDFNAELQGNVRSRGYFVVRTNGNCPFCRAWIPLTALALPSDHEILAAELDEGGAGEAPGAWEAAGCGALLFYVAGLPESARRRIAESSPFYRYAYSAATQESYWANHCGQCGCLLEDHDLFCEPGGAFLPMSGEGGDVLEAIWIEDPIEAQAGGYSYDPTFLPLADGK